MRSREGQTLVRLFFEVQRMQQNKNFVAFLVYICYNTDKKVFLT